MSRRLHGIAFVLTVSLAPDALFPQISFEKFSETRELQLNGSAIFRSGALRMTRPSPARTSAV